MASQLVTRVSVETLSPDALVLLRKGYAAMQAIGDDRGFNRIAGIHGVPGHYCHKVDSRGIDVLFLPWHRAYLYYFEQYLRDQVIGTCIPWWDWTSAGSHTTGIPSAFSDEKDPTGQPNPLLKSHISVPPPASANRDTTRAPDPPAGLPSASTVADVLKLT